MSIALDIGSERIRSLRTHVGRLVGRQALAVYVAIPADAPKERVLVQSGVRYSRCEDSLLILGAEAPDYARLFDLPCLPLLPDGQLPPNDPIARQILATLLEQLLPEPVRPQELCCVTIPNNPDPQDRSNSELEFFTQLVQLRGYHPVVLHESMALVLAELGHDGFTGMALNCGAAGCDFSIAHRGVQIAHCWMPRGGRWIDEQLAQSDRQTIWDRKGNEYLDLLRVDEWKTSPFRSLVRHSQPEESLLAELYRSMLTRLIRTASKMLMQVREVGALPRELPIVCSGGCVQVDGFEVVLRDVLSAHPLPLSTGPIRCVENDTYLIARGGLIGAELEIAGWRPHAAA